ncbi:MAG: fumarylacetoacetate hydrolase family protein [Bacteroidota bacterium]
MQQELANIIDTATKNAQAVSQLSATHQFDLATAYEIQKLSISRRMERGEQLIGYKLGFTSRAKMEQMGVHEVIWGRLTDAMQIENGGALDFNKFIHPRAEPEIAFRVNRKIDSVIDMDNILDYITAVAPAIEIIDSRYERFKFSLEDVVADNCSSSAFVLGAWQEPQTSVQDLAITLKIKEATKQSGNSNAILGNPLVALVELSKMIVKYGEVIEAGAIVLAGAATSAEYIHQGDQVEAVFQDLGSVKLQVE